MRRHLLAAGIAAAALIPSLVLAQPICEQRDNKLATTAAGAGIGALVGAAVAGRDDRGAGAVVGGVGGAIVGSQLSKSRADCARAYGYYDSNGVWRASTVNQADRTGYYDRDGGWIDGAPNGYYDDGGRWISASTSETANGYYGADGRWNRGAATGQYDVNGRWIAGLPVGHRAPNGTWIADAQPGHYDANGRWIAGSSMGYYDSDGRWTTTAPFAEGYGSDVAYQGRGTWQGAPLDIRSRQTWLQQRIQRGLQDGSLTRVEALRAQRSLTTVVRQERSMRHYRGQLSARDQAVIQARLDAVGDSIRWARRNTTGTY